MDAGERGAVGAVEMITQGDFFDRTNSKRIIGASLRTYLSSRQAQQRDHTDAALCYARTEAHDELLWTLRMRGIAFEGREDGVRVAVGMVETWGLTNGEILV